MSPHTICLLLTPIDDPDTSLVRSKLLAHQWQVSTIHDPFRAIAELVLRERAQAARLGWGLGRGQNVALVVHKPANLLDADQLIAAVQRHLPSVAIWTAQNNELLPVTESQPNEPETDQRPASTVLSNHQYARSAAPHRQDVSRPAASASSAHRSPDLRLTDDPMPANHDVIHADHAREDSTQSEHSASDEQAASTLSADEIEMLLTDGPKSAHESQ